MERFHFAHGGGKPKAEQRVVVRIGEGGWGPITCLNGEQGQLSSKGCNAVEGCGGQEAGGFAGFWRVPRQRGPRRKSICWGEREREVFIWKA